MSLQTTRSVNRLVSVLLLLAAAGVPRGDIFAQESAVRTVQTSERTEAEPDLSITFQLENRTPVDGPIFLHQKKNSEYPAGLTKLALIVVYGTDVLHDENNKPQVKFDPQRLNANLTENGDQRGLTLKLPEGNNSEELVEVVLRVSGRNGRSNSRKLQVFLNAGVLVGQIIPDSLAADSLMDGPRIENLAFLGNRFEGSVLFIDEDSSGEWETGEPTTVVDANNKFRFPKSKAFFREHLIRPRVLWVDGNKCEADFHNHLVDPKKAWFKITDIEDDEGGEPQPEDADEEQNDGGEPIDEDPSDEQDDVQDGEGEAAIVEEKAIRVTWKSTAMPPDGKSWNTAFNSLKQALDAAAALNADTREIWVAQGVYLPPDKSGFQFGSDISIYGGFLGTENKRSERPRIRRGTTILSGDLGKNDGHFAPITSVDVTPDANLVATASEDRTVKLWELVGDTYKLKHTLIGHLQAVNSVSISANGTTVVSGSNDLTVRLWSVETGQLIAAIPPDPEGQVGHTASVRAVDFSPNSSQIATASSDGTVRIWNASTRELTKRLEGHTGEVTSVVFVDEATVVSGSVDRTVRVWNVMSDNSPQVLVGHTGPVSSLAMTKDVAKGVMRIVSGSDDSTVRVWKKDGLAGAGEFQSEHRLLGERYDMKLVSVDGESKIQTTGRALAVLAQVASGDTIHLRLFDGRGTIVIDESLADSTVTAVRTELANLWKRPNEQPLSVDKVKQEWAIHGLSLIDRAAVFFKLDDQFKQHPLFGDDFGPVSGVAFSNDGRTIVASHAAKAKPELGNTLSFWNVKTGELDHAQKIGTDISLSSIAVAPAEKQPAHNYRIFRGQADGSIAIWDRTALAREYPDSLPSSIQITCATVSRNGSKSAYGTADGKIEVKNADGMSLLSIDHGSTISSIALSDDGEKLAYSSDKKLFLANANMGATPIETDAHEKTITSIEFSSDSNRIVTGGADALVKVWNSENMSSLDHVHTFGGHQASVSCVGVVGENGNYKVVSGSDDWTLKVWDLGDKKLKNTIEYQAPIIECAITGIVAEPQILVSAKRVEFAPVRRKTTGNITLANHQLIDGGMTQDDDRILVASQNDPTKNGIYIASTGDWRRASDADEPREFVVEKIVRVMEGNTFRGRQATYGGPVSPALEVDELRFVDDFLPVRLKANVNVELRGNQNIDGKTTSAGSRVLLTGQTNMSQNGIYIAAGGDEVWKRAPDANTPEAFTPRKVVLIQEGRFANTLEAYDGPASPDLTADPKPILFVPRTDKPVVHLWKWTKSESDVPTMTRLGDLSSPQEITHLAIADGSQTILTGSGDGSFSIWERNTDRELRVIKTISAHQGSLVAMGMAGNGVKFASADRDTFRVWERKSFELSANGITGFVFDGPAQSDNATSVVTLPMGANDITIDAIAIQGGVTSASGGGLKAADNQRVKITDCVIEGNAAHSGGGVHLTASSTLTFERSSFAWNTAETNGGAVATFGKTTFDSCVFSANRAKSLGGGLFVGDEANAILQLSTIYGCHAPTGSAIENHSVATIEHSTIANNNSTSVDGFAVHSADMKSVTLVNSIIAVNRRNNSLSAELKSIVAPASRSNLFGKIIDVVNTSEFQTVDGTPWGLLKNGDDTVAFYFSTPEEERNLALSDLFQPFGDFGGIHPTLALHSDSFAIGRGLTGVEHDQRGSEYVRNYMKPDIGAFEWQPLPASHSDVYEYDNSKTDFEALGDPFVDAPLLNDGAPCINSTLAISKDALSVANPTVHFQQVRLVATDNIAQLLGHKRIDGLLTVNGDRVLLSKQGGNEASPRNGIYIANDDEWQRAEDSDESREMLAFKTVFVAEGNRYANSTWTLLHDVPHSIPVLETTDLKFDNSSTPTTYGQVQWSNNQFHYRLKPHFNNTHFLGRDEINYITHFGDRVSPPTKVTIWTVAPPRSVDETIVHRFVVNTTADHVIPESGPINFNEGGLTLREAMLLAEQTDGNDEIRFATDVFAEPSVIQLVEPLGFGSEANGSLNIVGPGAEKLVIRAGNGETPGHRGLVVSSVQTKSPRITISHLSLRACDAQDANGGAVHIAGNSNVNIEFVAFVGNKAKDGAAIFSSQAGVNVSQCTFTENDLLQDEGRTVRLPGEPKVTASVFWSNRLKGEPITNEKSIYDGETNRNFYEEPRFVKTQAAPSVMELDIRLRRDSLAFQHGAAPWAENTPVKLGALVRPRNADETVVFECVNAGTGTTGAMPPDNWPAEIGETVTESTTGVVWKRVEEKLRTFRFLGAYPKFPNDSDLPFGSTGDADDDTLFVDRWVRTPGDGGSWKYALPSLHDAIEKAAADYRVTTIKIAGDKDVVESYKPMRPYAMTTLDHADSPNADWTFILQHGLKLEGGYQSAKMFASDAEDTRDENLVSDPASYPTILSGQLTPELYSEHVLTANGVRGFDVSRLTVTNGRSAEYGGGLFMPGTSHWAGGKVSGVYFLSNEGSSGGAIYLDGGILEIGQSSFRDNKASSDGGAISVVTGTAKLRVTNTTLANNSSKNGGAIHVASGRISMDHVTMVRNEATGEGGIAGLFVADQDSVEKITNCIICKNLHAEASANSNLSLGNSPDDSPHVMKNNVVNAEAGWKNFLLAEWKYNEFQTATGTKSNGPTPTIAILPQIPYRMGPSTLRLTEASEPRSPESATDQRGAPGTSLAGSDVGAFERQYFHAADNPPARFFVVDDGQTGIHLWAETGDLQYIQLSQHRQATNPIVLDTAANSVDFGLAGSKYKATEESSGFVQRSSVFPSAHPEAHGSANSVGKSTYYAKSEIKLTLGTDGMTHKLIIKDEIAIEATRKWTVTITEPDGKTSTSTGTDSELTLAPQTASYVVQLKRGETNIHPIKFKLGNVTPP